MGVDLAGTEQARVLGCARSQSVDQEPAKGTAQPLVGGNVEANFFPGKNCGRQFPFHELFQNELLPRAANLERCGQRCAELDNAMVKKGRPHLKRMSHAHAVGLGQDVIGKIVFLIKPQVG